MQQAPPIPSVVSILFVIVFFIVYIGMIGMMIGLCVKMWKACTAIQLSKTAHEQAAKAQQATADSLREIVTLLKTNKENPQP